MSVSRFFDPDGRLQSRPVSYGKPNHHYDPNQPRVPAGYPNGGEWTKNNYGLVLADLVDRENQLFLSDVARDYWRPGAQYAQRRTGGRSGEPPPTPAQRARLEEAETRADAAVREVHSRDPKWEPRPSLYSTIEGRIAAAEGRAKEAEAYFRQLVADCWVPRAGSEWFTARGQGRDFRAGERAQGDEIGNRNGCSTCGTPDPGTRRGHWVLDHQPPNVILRYVEELREREALTAAEQRILERGEKIISSGQRLYPQCMACSLQQGNSLSQWKRR